MCDFAMGYGRHAQNTRFTECSVIMLRGGESVKIVYLQRVRSFQHKSTRSDLDHGKDTEFSDILCARGLITASVLLS